MNDILLIMKNLKELNKTIEYLFYLNNFTGLPPYDASKFGKMKNIVENINFSIKYESEEVNNLIIENGKELTETIIQKIKENKSFLSNHNFDNDLLFFDIINKIIAILNENLTKYINYEEVIYNYYFEKINYYILLKYIDKNEIKELLNHAKEQILVNCNKELNNLFLKNIAELLCKSNIYKDI